MNTETISIKKLKPNPANPRTIRDDKFHKLVQSVKDFPQMLEIRPIVVNDQYEVLGGNMRLRACIEAGMKEVTIIRASELTEDQQRRFIVVDNVGFGDFDMDALANEWDAEELQEWGVDLPVFGEGNDANSQEAKNAAVGSLQEKFIVPPFSILDTRQGYWQERKRNWKTLIEDNGESRENTLFRSAPNDPISKKLQESGGVSILDPVLSECICHWFGVPGGTAFDCFAGDSVFGYVAAHTGQTFTGIELRQEQAELNAERVKGMTARYVCDDGQNVCKHIAPESQDLFFSCPPYFDLEVYSDLENDASNQGDYQAFLQILKNAFSGAVKCLKNNRFAVIVVGDIRDKKGFYRCFPDDIKGIFKEQGMSFYNDIVLVEPLGTLPVRVAKAMANRKLGKCHQNVLVFYKGDPREIKNIYPKIEIPETDGSENVEL